MTRYLLSLSFAAGIAGLILGFSTGNALAAKRVALVVGNSAYQNVPQLPNPERDATAMAKLFNDAGFETVLVISNVSNLDFKRALRKFEDVAEDAEIAVVYYAGHGIEIRGTNYLVPVDAKLANDRDAEDEAITLNRLVESIDGAKRLRLILLDACRDNPFVATMKRMRQSASRTVTSGLGKVEPTSTDTLIAYAAKAGATAEDGSRDHSPFTIALLDNLTVPGLDIRLAFGRIRDQVMKITANRQEPFVYGSLGGGTVSLVPQSEKPQEPDIAKVKTDYDMVLQVGTEKAWEVFLGTYKVGFYADLARAQVAKLRGSAEPALSTAPKVAVLEPPPPPEPAKPSSDELRAWNGIRDSDDKEAIRNFIKRFPNSPLAVNAQHRLDILERAAREREENARAEREAAQRAENERRPYVAAAREAAQRAEEERRAKEAAAREAAQRAEEERRAKAAATREAAQRAENERRAKEAAAARETAQRAEEERRAKEAATREAAQRAENERRAKEAAAAREAAQRADEERRAKEAAAAREAAQRADEERRAKEAAAREAAQRAEEERRAKEAAQRADEGRRAKEAAAREGAQRVEEERRTKEAAAAREAAQRAEEERRAKEAAARKAAQQAEEERRAKEAAAVREAAQRAEEERRAKEAAAAREAAQRADEERRAKEAAVREAAQRAEEERRAKEAARSAENERRAKGAIESEKFARDEAACKREQARLDDLVTAGNSDSVRENLKQLSISLTCERLRSQVVASLEKARSEPEKSSAPSPAANTPELIASAQRELTRIGCYSGESNGKIDDATKVAIKTYQKRRRVPVGDVEVTDRFVGELSKQRLRICPTEVAEPPSKHQREEVAEPPSKHRREQAKKEEAKKEQAKNERAESKKSRQARSERVESTKSRAEFRMQAAPQARQEASRPHSPMIGVGF